MKKYLAMLLASALVLCAVPAVMAAPSAPTGTGVNFFANGTPVTITGEAPAAGTLETVSGFSATGTAAYISWQDGGITKYVGVSADAVVFGGSNGSAAPVTVDSTSITMTGGTVKRIYGGNYGKDNDANNQPSVVSGNVDIHISGDAVVTDIIAGGGLLNTAVNGTVSPPCTIPAPASLPLAS